MQADYEGALRRPCTMMALTVETAVRKGMERDKAIDTMARLLTERLDEFQEMPEAQFRAHVVSEVLASIAPSTGGTKNEM